jgi:hypothetical protein
LFVYVRVKKEYVKRLSYDKFSLFSSRARALSGRQGQSQGHGGTPMKLQKKIEKKKKKKEEEPVLRDDRFAFGCYCFSGSRPRCPKP